MTVGLSYKKLDLHIHTPASQDFVDKSVTPDDIVNKALELDLDAIAITDHNTGAWIDLVKQAASQTNLTVYPGVEIHCADGKRGIHMIALFDVDKGSEHVKGLLSRLGITPECQGEMNELTDDLGLTNIVDIIQEEKWQGIAIPAHVSSEKGIINDMKGQKRIQIIQHANLIALEDRWDNSKEDEASKKNAINFLDGTDPDYRRKIAVYQASDNPSGTSKHGHGLEGIGSRYTYFKMERIDLESLRQCFFDPDVRILQNYEFKQFEYPRIAGISIRQGFFDGESAVFNHGLNSVLGGKGTGKSLLIELMRFALNQPPEREEIKLDHENKLSHRLGDFGVVDVDFVDENGNNFRISRTHDPGSNGYDEINYDPSQVFPVLFLSQNEIIRIAEDESLQLHFIDQFFPSKIYEERIKSLESALLLLDKQLADGLQAKSEVTEHGESVSTLEMKLTQLDKKLDAPIFRRFAAAQSKQQAIKSQYDCISEFHQLASDFQEKVNSIELPEPLETQVDDDVLHANLTSLRTAKQGVESHIEAMISLIAEVKSGLANSQEIWRLSYERIRNDHVEHVREEGGDDTQLTSEREQLQQRLTQRKALLRAAQQKAQRITEIAEKREMRLNELEKEYEQWRSARVERCHHFQMNSGGKLKLSVIALSDTNEFQRRLLALKVGSNVRDSDIEKLATTIQPRNFVQSLLEYGTGSAVSALQTPGTLSELAQGADLPLERVVKLADFLLSRDDLVPLLEAQYKAHPKDRPDIKFGVGNGRFESLDSISVGQKCTALLIMTLTDGKMPVVIDQPEDSLDIRSIWEDICAKVRANKNQRQFIFTTHNSSVAVASDSDNFIILESTSAKGSVVYSGSMDSQDVGDEVLKYLEGGPDPYRRKFFKYRAETHLNSIRN